MPSPRLPDHRSLVPRGLALCGVLVATAVPIACAHGSTDTDLPGFGGYGGAGGAGGAHPTTSSSTSGFPTSSSSTTGSTGGFPSSSSTGGFPSSSSTSGFPSSSSTSGFPSSSSTSGFTSSSSTSSTSSGSSVCDGTADCNGCITCADGGPCYLLSLECQLDFDCPYVADCAFSCTTQSCFDTCLSIYDPISTQLFVDYYNCLGCSCQLDCAVPASSCP